MTVLTPAQIYQVARQAGFDPDEAVTFTAIALAESGGDPDANAAGTEDSRGLWQVNVGAHGNVFGDLYDPLTNARAAFQISDRGSYLYPWSVTHDDVAGTSRDYRTYLDEARQGAAAAGSGAGDLAPSTADGYTDPSTDGPVIQPVDGVSGDEYDDTWGAARSGGRTHEGVDILADEGTPVRAIASGTVVDDFTSDLGGVVVRVEGDDGRYYYYAHLQEGSVDHLTSGQRVDAGEVIGGVGDTGNAPEGVHHLHLGIYEDDVAVNPYPMIVDLPTYEEWASQQGGFAIDDGADIDATDQDEDGLTDEYERLLGTDPRQADSDQDDLSDRYETTVSHTDPRSADTDEDERVDSLELATSSAAGTVPIPAAATEAGFAGAGTIDRDRDDLSDLYEHRLGTDPTGADSDADRVPDAVEVAHGSDPLSIDSNQDGVTDWHELRLGTLGEEAPGADLEPPTAVTPQPGDPTDDLASPPS